MLCSTVCAETKIWTLKSGKQLEAEYMALQMKKVVLKDVKGKELRVSLSELSKEDQRYVELANPPTLKVDFLQSFIQRDPRPSPIWVNNSPLHLFYYTFGARVTQKNAGKYEHKLTIEIYAIGQQVYDRDKYRLLLKEASKPFILSEENGRKFEFHDDTEIKLMRYVMADQHPRGERFAENLVLVKDERGEIIAHSTSRKWLYTQLDKLNQLPVGAWFNENCDRVHPTSPKEQL